MLEISTPTLVARAQNGETAVIGELYDRYHLSIFRYLYYRVGDQQAAEDLTSEVFLRMIRALNGYRPQSVAFEAWLFQIARNLAIDYYRKMNDGKITPLEEHYVSGEDPEQRLEHTLTSELLSKALARLNEMQRDVIVLRFINGLSITQVAQALHKSEDAIKALQRRGLSALREILSEWEITYV